MGRLQRLYVDGVSFRDIAADIGVTRNAVIGKVHRMQLEPRQPVVSKKAPLIYQVPRPRYRPRPKELFIVAKWSEPEPDIDYRCVITELTDTTCRYPLWLFNAAPYTERFYCGAPGAEMSTGRPYCPKHMLLCNPQRQ